EKLHRDIVHISDIIHTHSRELHDARLTYIRLVAAATSLCREVGERNNIDIDFKHESFLESVPSQTSLSVFRVLLDALDYEAASVLRLVLRQETAPQQSRDSAISREVVHELLSVPRSCGGKLTCLRPRGKHSRDIHTEYRRHAALSSRPTGAPPQSARRRSL